MMSEKYSARWKKILLIAWPLIIANSFWNLQLTIDRVFLGMHSTEALGAAMAVMGVFWVPMALLQGTAGYITTFVAQYFGANEQHKIGASVWQSFYVSIIGGLFFLVLNLFSSWFFGEIGHAAKTQALEVEYFNALSYSALPTALVAAISGFFTGLGRTQTVIWINFVGLILNAILDYIFIFGNFGCSAMGVAGAGYATSIATYGAAIFGIYLIFTQAHENQFKLKSQWKIDLPLLKQFLRFGLPSGLQWALEGLAFTVFLIIMGRLQNGEAALASSSIAVTVMMLSVLPSMGVAQAVMTLMGQKLGQKNPEEAQVITWDGVKISSIYMLIMGLTFWLFPEFYLSWFKNEQNALLWAQVSELAPKILGCVAIFTIFDSAYLNISFALKGAGDTKFVSAIALIVPWPVMVLPAYLLKDRPNADIVSWYFVILYSLSIVTVLTYRFRQGKWKSMSVIG
ncbi:MAG: MATE family efflux transporter [Bacteriovoracaceae bacterium]|nr:MATE family efflux transporter [Bacteriovoracaceae bacterium]